MDDNKKKNTAAESGTNMKKSATSNVEFADEINADTKSSKSNTTTNCK